MFKKYSLSKQINLNFLAIIGCTFISTALAILLTFFVALRFIYPANYYDQQVYKWIDYVTMHSNELLDGKNQTELQQMLNFREVTYNVINFENNESYGNGLVEGLTKQQLISKLNTREGDYRNNFTQFVPLLTMSGELGGCFIINYPIHMTPMENKRLIYVLFGLLVWLLPFIFLSFYMWFFGRGLRKNIMNPLKKLIWASKKINDNDLDFKLSYDYQNEFQEVIVSFEQMRQTLKETLYEQWKIEQQQKELIASLAHDLRSPLTLMKGHLEMLQDGAYRNKERCLKYLNVLEGATERATLLVEDLNLLSQVEQVDFILKKEKVLVREYLLNQINVYETFVAEKNVKLMLDIEEINPKLQIEIDPNRITRVLDNLMMNSLCYAPNSSSIMIKVISDESYLYLDVIDEGKGFSDEDLKYAMKKFYRGSRARTKDGGSGLGLYISKKIIELHSGEIKLSNTSEGGAKVTILLPILRIYND